MKKIFGIFLISILLTTLTTDISAQTNITDNISEEIGISNLEETEITESNFLADAEAPAPQAGNYTPVNNPNLKREVYGFLWYPYVDSSADNAASYLHYELLTTISYAGLTLKKDGTVNQTNGNYKVWKSQRLVNILKNARAKGVKIHPRFATFGSEEVNYLLATEARRKKAVQSIIWEINNAPVTVDGVNIDFEPVPAASRNQFTSFIKLLRTEMDKIDPELEIVIDTFASTAKSEAGFDLKELNKYTDGFFVMSFSFVSKSTSEKAGSFNPISAYRNTADQYLEKLPANKIILGFPFYTNRWATTNDSLRAPKKNNGGGGLILYKNAYAEARVYGKKYDTNQQSAYYSYYECGDKPGWRQVYFDDERAQIAKFKVADNKNLQGIGFWTFNQNLGSMDTWNAIYEVFGDKSKINKPTKKAGFEELSYSPNPNCKPPNSTITQPPSSRNTTLNFEIGLQGIGKTGTNTRPNLDLGNKSPIQKTKSVNIDIFGANGNRVKNVSTNITYDPNIGKYKGTIKTDIPQNGIYNLYFWVPGYLIKQVDQTINTSGNINIPSFNLSTGDINQDKTRNLLDWNLLLACSSFNTRNKTLCADTSEFIKTSDMNSDGKVDQTDFTLWLQEFNPPK